MKNIALFAIPILLLSCSSSKNHIQGWIETTVPDQYGNIDGYKALKVEGYELSRNVDDAYILYYVSQDMISGGYKPIFLIMLDENTYSDAIVFETPKGEKYEFECYDGFIFNIDINSDNIQRLIPLFKHEYLTITQGDKQFTINCDGFYEL